MTDSMSTSDFFMFSIVIICVTAALCTFFATVGVQWVRNQREDLPRSRMPGEEDR